MSRKKHLLFVSLFFALSQLIACSGSGEDYFPLEEGRYWRYKMAYKTMDGPAESLYVMENLPVKKVDGEKVFTRKALDGRLFHYQKEEQGIIMTDHEIIIAREKKSWPTQHYVYKLPLEVGQEWQGRSESRVLIKTGPPQKTVFRIVANVPMEVEIDSLTDRVEVPAGVFENCLRISMQGSSFVNAGNYVGKTIVSIKETNWYAPGVGLVKSIREETTTSAALNLGTMMLELESYR